LLLMRMPAMHDQRRAIEAFCEKASIGIALEPIRHVAVPVRNHAVGRHNGITFGAEASRPIHPERSASQTRRELNRFHRSRQWCLQEPAAQTQRLYRQCRWPSPAL